MLTEPTANDYRMTELGPLPPEWRVVRLGEIFTPVSKKLREQRIQDNQLYRLLTVRLYARGVTLRTEQIGKQIGTKTLYVTEVDDFVFSKIDARNGAWGFVSENSAGGLVSSDFPILRLARKLADINFIEFLLSQSVFWKPLSNLSMGTTNRRRLQISQFLSIPIPLPPLAEQRAIAHTLRAAQQAKLSSERMVAALRTVKQSLMHHLFRYGPVPLAECDRVPLRETPLGPLPAHWQVVRLGEVVEKPQYGYTTSAQAQPTGVKLLRITDIQDGNVFWSSVPYCVIHEADLQKYLLKTGDILIARIGATTGKAFFIRECPTSVFASYLIRLRSISYNVSLPDFLWYFTNTSTYWKQINTNKGGRLKEGINIPILQSLLLPLPPLAEQQRIAAILQAVDRRIAAAESRVRALADLFAALLRDLMTARRRIPPEVVAQFAG